MKVDSPNCKWIPKFFQYWTCIWTIKSWAEVLISSDAEFKSKDLTIASGIHQQVLKHWLPKSVMSSFSFLETKHRTISILGVIELRVHGTHSISTNWVIIWDCVNPKYWFGSKRRINAVIFHWVESVWKHNTQHNAKLGQYLGFHRSPILVSIWDLWNPKKCGIMWDKYGK